MPVWPMTSGCQWLVKRGKRWLGCGRHVTGRSYLDDAPLCATHLKGEETEEETKKRKPRRVTRNKKSATSIKEKLT
jgi:hypothetical protein